jgi:hypothetical protein
MDKQIVKDCIVKVVKEDGYWLKLGQKYKVHSTAGWSWNNQIQIYYAGEILGLNKDFFELSSKYEITDVVTITVGDWTDANGKIIPIGQVGTIVEVLPNQDHTYANYKVEFCDEEGKTLYQDTIEETYLLKLRFN